MKKWIFATILAMVSIVAIAQSPNDVMVRQRNSTNTGWLDKFLSPPVSGADGIMYINNAVSPPLATVLAIGSGLTVSGGVLSVPPGGTVDWSSITGKPSTFPPSAHTQAFSTITATPTTLAGYGITDAYPLSGNPSGYITSLALSPYLTSAIAASTYVTSAVLTSGLAGKQNTLSLTTTGTGAASLSGATLNIPTPSVAVPFNFSQPTARTLAVSTSYQATDTSKAAIIYPSYACQNATQVLASSGCTIQVRMGSGALTCSTGTVYYTQSLTVNLGVLLTQNSTNPVPIMLPAGASFILCPTVGTFTATAVEQTAG